MPDPVADLAKSAASDCTVKSLDELAVEVGVRRKANAMFEAHRRDYMKLMRRINLQLHAPNPRRLKLIAQQRRRMDAKLEKARGLTAWTSRSRPQMQLHAATSPPQEQMPACITSQARPRERRGAAGRRTTSASRDGPGLSDPDEPGEHELHLGVGGRS
jgi:hypothetical protein